jgi:hypothetical protein
VEVVGADARFLQVVGEILRHPLGERRDEDAVALSHPVVDLPQEVVDLALGRPNRDRRVDETGRPDHLLDRSLGVLLLVWPRASPRRR